MAYTIYLRTNLVNGKQYVGQTSNFKRRENEWNCLATRYANQYVVEDREKYGLDNFKTVILAETDSMENACELEQKYISEFNTIYPNGYNRAIGGKTNIGGIKGCHNGKEFKKGNIPWNKDLKGIHLSPETEFEGKPIVQLKGNILIAIWPTEKEAAKNVEGCHTSSIAQCCKGKRKSAGGYGWMYKEDYDKMQ